jgi:hypothetical protein
VIVVGIDETCDAHDAIGTGAVVDHDRLSPPRRELFSEQA